jgi:AsmA protein
MDDTVISPSGAITVRRVFLGLGGLVCTLLLGLFLLPYVLPGSVEKILVSKALEKVLQRPVNINGEASFSLVPSIQLLASEIVVPAANDNTQPVLVDMASLHLEAGTVALLSSTLAIDRLIIDEPVLRLNRGADGQANWQPAKGSTVGGNLAKPDYSWGWWHDFRIGDVRLTNGRLVFNDRLLRRSLIGENANLQARISDVTGANDGLSINGGMDVNGEPVRLRLDLGSMKQLLSGGRMPVVAEISAVPLTMRYQGTMANRQYLVSQGQMSVDAPSAQRLENWLGQIFAEPMVGGLHWKSRIFANGNRTTFDEMRLEMGAGRYAGNLHLETVIGGRKLNGTLLATNLELGSLSNMLPGVMLLQNLTANLRLEWQQLSYGGMQFGKGEMKVALSPKNRRLTLDLTRMALYGGRASGEVKIARGEGMTSLDANFEVTRVSSGDLLQVWHASAPLTGVTSVRLGLFSVGSSAEEMLAALRGKGEFNIVRGTVVNAGLADHLRVADREALGFSQMIGSFEIDQGIIEGRDLLLKSQNLSLVGDGVVDLSRGEIDIHLQSLSRKKNANGEDVPEVHPFRLQGNMAEIEIINEES